MTDQSPAPRSFKMPTRALLPFFALTFAITWSIAGVFIFAPQWSAAHLGEIDGSHPLFFLATWAPALSAFLLVFYYGGRAGLKAFFARLLMWRGSPGWAAFILIGIPLVYMAGSLIKGGPLVSPLPPQGMGAAVAGLFLMLFLGPVEEFGWRGLVQPILQRHVAPFWAGAIIGTIWGIWHIPAFFLANTVFAGWNFFPFFIGNITLAVLVTPVFNSARGNLLWPMAFHWQLINPFWPDAQPWDTWILVGVTAIVVWVNRRVMFRKEGAVTGVI